MGKINLKVRGRRGGLPITPLLRGLNSNEEVLFGSPRVNSIPGSAVDDFLRDRPFYVAHRLGGTEFPEHTLTGMQASLDNGFKAFEFSTYRSKDGVYVGSHDWTTERTTGQRYEIWDTDWETLQTLQQESGRMLRLEEVVDMLPDDGVLFLDHKATSSKATANDNDMASEEELFNKLEELFDEPQKRVVFKMFRESTTAERARKRGYKVNCMLYPDQLAHADFSRWDILGMEFNADQESWNILEAQGKPTIAHIITNANQESTGLSRGADGIMSSVPTIAHPKS